MPAVRDASGRFIKGSGGGQVRLNHAAIALMTQSPAGTVGRMLFQRAKLIETAAKRLCPVDHGLLRSSIRAEAPVPIAGRLTCWIGSPLPYALFVHEGTGIYGPTGSPIRPKSGQFLRFEARGGARGGSRPLTGPFVFARQVVGSPGVPYLRNALAAIGR